jgi:mono/diheme cytochrome c family protein
MRWLKRFLMLIAFVVGMFGVMQLVPYGRDHTNPAGTTEPKWDSPETRALAERACFDCHSNRTKWPWYSHVAPFSWVVQRNVDAARATLNFSDWDHPTDMHTQAAANVLVGEMPPRSYRLMHPEARLTEQEKLKLAKGLQATFGLPWKD